MIPTSDEIRELWKAVTYTSGASLCGFDKQREYREALRNHIDRLYPPSLYAADRTPLMVDLEWVKSIGGYKIGDVVEMAGPVIDLWVEVGSAIRVCEPGHDVVVSVTHKMTRPRFLALLDGLGIAYRVGENEK